LPGLGNGPEVPIWEISTAALGVRNSSVEAMQAFGSLLRKRPAGLIVTLRIDEYSAPNRKFHCFGSTLPVGNLSLRDLQERLCGSGTRKDYYIFVTALVELREATERGSWFSNLDTADFTSNAQAFGAEPNALPNAVIA
jgi:hypothetical protein